nr:MAG TPA: hypothetical protein [Caudoviricetes sp.]
MRVNKVMAILNGFSTRNESITNLENISGYFVKTRFSEIIYCVLLNSQIGGMVLICHSL